MCLLNWIIWKRPKESYMQGVKIDKRVIDWAKKDPDLKDVIKER